MNIGKFSVRNPVLIDILMVAILVMGLFSFFRLPQELFSDISFSWVFISVPYPGVSAEEVEKNLTIKIEEEISDVDRIKRISSTSREGVAFVQVEFEDDISDDEFKRLYQEVRTEFDKVPMPDGTLDPWIDDFSTSDFMAIITVILSADESVDLQTINLTARDLREKLLDVDDVSKVEIVGGQDREVWIEADRDRLESYGISLNEVADAIRNRNLNIPGGNLEVGTRSYILQMIGQLEKPSDYGNVIVRRTPGKGSVKVSDIADINNGFADPDYNVRFNGKKAISLLISKKIEGNSIQVVDAAKEVVESFQQTAPPGIDFALSNDTTIMIRDILKKLGSNSVMGFIFLVAVLLVFLGFRNSFITAMGIPLTFAITFVFMEWYGESLNGNSLFALVLVLGMIVDHAIVIMENSYRYRQKGLSATESAIRGTNEVVKPVLAGTLTTVAAFLPLMLLPGIMGKFMRAIPVVVSLALVASTIEALFFIPLHFVEWGGKVKEEGTGFIGRWQGTFKKFLGKVYRRRWLTLGLTILMIVITIISTPLVKQDLFSGEEFTQFFLDIEMPVGTPREKTNEIAARFEDRLMPLIGNGEIVSLNTTVGFMQTDTDWLTASNYAQITLDITEKKDGRERPMVTIMKELEKKCADIPGAEKTSFRMMRNGPPVDKPVSFRLTGDNYDDMSSISRDFQKMLAEYPELYNIEDNFDKGKPELRISIREERASELGLSAGWIGMYIRSCFDGIDATKYYDEDDEIDVIVKFAEADRISVEDVMHMKIPTPDGRMVPFSTVCSMKRGISAGNIRRTDQKREITVSADADDKQNIRVIMAKVEETFNERYKDLYPDIRLKMGGEFAEFNKVLQDILRLALVGIFLIYLILGAQFKSFVQPIIIITTVFFALVGCTLFLVISQTPFSIVVMFAGVALLGISVNDSIVLISFVNELRCKGMTVAEAVVEGAAVRLRPIILTSVTTIGGLIPMSLGLGGSSETWSPMASTIIFGLFFSTVGTLVVIPCIYGIVDDVMRKFGMKMRTENECGDNV